MAKLIVVVLIVFTLLFLSGCTIVNAEGKQSCEIRFLDGVMTVYCDKQPTSENYNLMWRGVDTGYQSY